MQGLIIRWPNNLMAPSHLDIVRAVIVSEASV